MGGGEGEEGGGGVGRGGGQVGVGGRKGEGAWSHTHLKARLLERAPIGECEGPRLLLRLLVDEHVHLVERYRGVLLGHAAREEGDPRHSDGHGALHARQCGRGDLWIGHWSRCALTTPCHVGLEQ